jgi:hypothetical protein
MPIINGKTVNNLPKFATEQDVINAVRETRPNRLVVMKTPQGFKSLDGYKKTQVPSDAIFKIVPRRVKAFFGYDGNNKSNLTKQIIFSQVSALEKKVFPQGIEIDANYNWFRIKQYRLPLEWRKYNKQEVVPLLIVIPDQFPSLPPNGFYLPSYIVEPPGSGHFFSPGFGGSHNFESSVVRKVTDNLKWYCSRILPEAWSPAPIIKLNDWMNGDNLFDVIYLVNNVLMDPTGD